MTAHGRLRWIGLAATVFAFGGAAGGEAAETATSQVVDRTALRVCSDPNNLPFSNDEGEGFENEIAELLASDLGVPVEYTWYPSTVGFVRNTLNAGRCDLMMGVTATNELVQNSNPYYRSAYALVYRADSGIDLRSLEDPALTDLMIGTVQRTPPVTVLAQRGLLDNMRAYDLMVDTRHYSPGRDLVTDVAKGTTDVGVVWGPIAGYWAMQQDVPMTVVPLVEEPGGVQLSFRITMGVRRSDQEWKREINGLIETHRDEIDAILLDYGVPLLDRQGNLIRTAGRSGAVEQPDGYRMEDYRAPVPAELDGATTASTAEVEELMRGGDVVLVDVLPADRPPADRDDERIWRAKPHDSIPGAVWLPNVGYGELAPEFATYFKDNLERLTAGDRDTALVFFCEADCWMSWNAAKRAIEYGYSNVHWYPEGTDGWDAAGQLLVPVEPVPMPGFDESSSTSG